MGIGLLEYAANHPDQEEPPQERQAVNDMVSIHQEQQDERKQIEDLKLSIETQLEQGNSLQYILYAAVKAIGLLSHDPEWAIRQRQQLDAVYEDLEQIPMIPDAVTVAQKRLEARSRNYIDNLRKQLTSDLASCERIEKALKNTLFAVDNIAQEKGSGSSKS